MDKKLKIQTIKSVPYSGEYGGLYLVFSCYMSLWLESLGVVKIPNNCFFKISVPIYTAVSFYFLYLLKRRAVGFQYYDFAKYDYCSNLMIIVLNRGKISQLQATGSLGTKHLTYSLLPVPRALQVRPPSRLQAALLYCIYFSSIVLMEAFYFESFF